MNEDFFRERLAQLRNQKGVSARDMSLSLGQSESYINKIENGKAFPAMRCFSISAIIFPSRQRTSLTMVFGIHSSFRRWWTI